MSALRVHCTTLHYTHQYSTGRTRPAQSATAAANHWPHTGIPQQALPPAATTGCCTARPVHTIYLSIARQNRCIASACCVAPPSFTSLPLAIAHTVRSRTPQHLPKITSAKGTPSHTPCIAVYPAHSAAAATVRHPACCAVRCPALAVTDHAQLATLATRLQQAAPHTVAA